MYRWSLCTGGPCVQVVLVCRWSLYVGGLYVGGPCIQVVLVYRWSLYTGGPCIQVVLVYRWSLCTGSPCIQVAFKTLYICTMEYGNTLYVNRADAKKMAE